MHDFENLENRFISYTEFDTMSDEAVAASKRPSTEGQTIFLNHLKAELEAMGLEPYIGDEHVLACRIKGNAAGSPVAFMAHVDTADDVPGNGVRAVVHHDYDGSPIVLGNVVIDPESDPDLLLYRGSDIITSSGGTLLGSDDKAGVAIIMEAVSYMLSHPEFKHPDVEIFFTPDEETGHGMDMFPYDHLTASTCYTIDGEREGELETECFNAASVRIVYHGTAAHLGSARGVMKNAVTATAAFISSLPQAESPEATDGRYGYYCAGNVNGTVAEASVGVYIRDFDANAFERRIENVKALASSIGAVYGVKTDIESSISYRNMADANRKNPEAVDAVMRAAERLGQKLESAIIRGGTDGARIAEHGISSPNIYTGGHNLHSLKEWVALDAMKHSLCLVLGIIGEYLG